jgi:hypothetical protein
MTPRSHALNEGGACTQADYFKMYTIYCSNHPTAVDTKIKLAKKNSNFRKFIAVRPPSTGARPDTHWPLTQQRSQLAESDAACRGLNLNDYLIKVRACTLAFCVFFPEGTQHLLKILLDVVPVQPVQRICKYPLLLRVRSPTSVNHFLLPTAGPRRSDTTRRNSAFFSRNWSSSHRKHTRTIPSSPWLSGRSER